MKIPKSKLKKYYFEDDAEMCYQLGDHLEQAEEKGLDKIDLYEAVPDRYADENMMFCSIYGVMERGDCGKACEDYRPVNGKWGICHRQGKLYEQGKMETFIIKGKET